MSASRYSLMTALSRWGWPMKLIRFRSNEIATLGILNDKWWTVERPWKTNERRVSCIPSGIYDVVRHTSPSKGLCWSVQDVVERTHILIHVANWSHELMGCIAPGVGIDLGENMVTSSRRALDEMLGELPEEWTLEIVDAF